MVPGDGDRGTPQIDDPDSPAALHRDAGPLGDAPISAQTRDARPRRAIRPPTVSELRGALPEGELVEGVCLLGFVADLISKPTMIGYRNGLALTILVGQLPKLFGFSVEVHGCFGRVMAFVHGVATGETVPAALAIGMSCGVPECAHADQWRSMVSSGHA